MKRRDLSTVTRQDVEQRLAIALAKMTPRQADIFLSARFDEASCEELAARHGVTVQCVTRDFARALLIWQRCLHARFPRLVWPWL